MSYAAESNTKAKLLNSASTPAKPDVAPLPVVGSELVAQGYSVNPVPYHRLREAVMSGLIPAQRSDSGRIGIRRGDYPAVAAALGLVSAAAAEAVPA